MLQSTSEEGESVQRQCAYKGTPTNMIEPVVAGAGITRGEEEILSTKGIQERGEEIAIGAGIGIGAGEGVVEQLNSMAMVAMVEVLVRGGCCGEGRRMELFIVIESELCMFQVLFKYPRVFFGRIPFPLD